MTEPLHVAVAFEGYGWHPEAWRHTPERRSVLSGRYWAELARTAERGLLDFITPSDDDPLRAILAELVDGADLKVFADLYVSSSGWPDPRSDALVAPGSAAGLVELVLRWQQQIGLDGVRLRPTVTAVDLPFIVDEVVPLLRDAGGFRTAYREGETLRARLGLPVAENRYQEANRP